MAIDQKVMEEVQVGTQPISLQISDDELKELEKSLFRGDIEAALMETQARLEEAYKSLNSVGYEQYSGLLGKIRNYLADWGVMDGRKRLKGKRKNIARDKVAIESLIRKAQGQVERGTGEYGACLGEFMNSNLLMLGYESRVGQVRSAIDQKKEELNRAQSTSDPKDKSYLTLIEEIGQLENDVMTTDYKMERAASKSVSCDRRLDRIDYKRKRAMQQVGFLSKMESALENVLDIAEGDFGDGVNPLETLAALKRAAESVQGIKEYLDVIYSQREAIDNAMNDLPTLVQDQFSLDDYALKEVTAVKSDQIVAQAKKAMERRLKASI